MRMDVHHSGLVSEAPTGKDGLACKLLCRRKTVLKAFVNARLEEDFHIFHTGRSDLDGSDGVLHGLFR